MLAELCKELRNYDFNKRAEKHFGKFEITEGAIDLTDIVVDGQYFRIVGSLFNDGIYEYPHTFTKDEVFDGAVWAMAIPEEVVALADEIAAWNEKYGNVNSVNMSPYNSESFGGYSYSKSGGGSGSGDGSSGTWQSVFASRLNKWRKI